MIRRIAATAGSILLAAGAGVLAMTSVGTQESPREARIVDAPPAPLAIGCGGGLVRSVAVAQDVQAVDQGAAAGTVLAARSEQPMSVFIGKSPISNMKTSAFFGSDAATVGSVYTTSVESGGAELAASSTHVAQSGDLQGIAVNACGRASMDQWLVGSSGKIGTSTMVVLTNPGKTPVAVNLEALGDVGAIPLGGSSTAVVGSGETKRIVLDGSLAERERIAVHVVTRSGGVYASLQTTSLDGYTPAGVSFVAPTHEGTDLMIPGSTIIKDSGGVLRIANPSTSTATVRISTVTSEGESSLPGAQSVEVSAKSVLDLSLQGLDAGVTSIRVSSDAPVVASAKTIAQAPVGSDVAWAVAREANTSGGVAFGSFAAQAAFVADKNAKVIVTPIGASGPLPNITVNVAAGAETVVDLPEGSLAAFYTSDQAVTGSVTVRNDSGIEWLPFASSEIEQRSMRVVLK